MVGVPGRSKACHTCKKRRIACGLQRPQCDQCIRANRVCGGYNQERIFIVGAGKTYQAEKKRPKPKSTSNQSKTSICSVDSSQNATPQSRRSSPTKILQEKLFETDPGWSLVSYPACRQQILSTFINGYVPASRLGARNHKFWLNMLPESPTLTKALETAMMAVCTAKIGRRSDDQSLIHASLKLYTQGLQELQKALWDPQQMYADETLAACMALVMYEVFECPSSGRQAYLSHQQGCSRLVKLRGPKAHDSGLGHQVFISFRLHTVLEALKNHQPCFLMEEAWMERPWKCGSKTPFDCIFDYLVRAPTIFAKADRLGKLDPWTSLQETLDIIDECFEIDAGVEKVFEEFEKSSPKPLYWAELSRAVHPGDPSDGTKVFPVAFHFVDLKTANILMYYWATLLMLWSGLCQLYGHLHILKLQGVSLDHPTAHEVPGSENSSDTWASLSPPPPSLNRVIRPLDHRTDIATVAWNICQSVEYCTQDEMLEFGAQSVAVPLQVTVETMKQAPQYERQVLWAHAILDRLSSKDLRILKYV